MSRMAGLTDGAEFGDTLYWDLISTAGGTFTASAAQKRTGNYAYKLTGAANATKNFPAAVSELWLRICAYHDISVDREWFYILDGGTVIAFLNHLNASNLVEMWIGPNQIFGIKVATSTDPVPQDQWNRLEVHLKIDNIAGEFDLRLDGATIGTFSGDTQSGGSTTASGFQVIMGGGADNIYFDDIGVNNTAGLVDNSWVGDGYVLLIKPDATGDINEFVNSAAAAQTTNWDYVNELPPDGDTSYVQSQVDSEQDYYNLETYDNTDRRVLRLWVEARAKDANATGGQISLNIQTAVTEHKSSVLTLGADYARFVGTEYTTNPDTASLWTESQIDSLQAGPESYVPA